jgi:hypothetical protein
MMLAPALGPICRGRPSPARALDNFPLACRLYLLRQAFEEAIHTHTVQHICESLGRRAIQHVP